ncbi:beta-galactosidase [Paenibacillus catalpae]|uniref:beta-galactosidase n=1 Tax=Paenibacillus catalpae TaxID=1045775 RepID=A0A1I1SSE6_9BACL|nr:beta-galactosidase [Paenibacillus catalpae]SFD49242.1 beta-galactosidase [Paenibacillus catalpae]
MLFAGTNYHPHDWPPERWRRDIELMREASFNIVRLGHLCWDSYEPSEGNFTFDWFDEVMDLFHEAGIKVVLDIATRPAPTWLHKKYPGISLTDSNGNRMEAQSRYMDDIGHPAFQEYALRFAEKLVRRYRNHPALYAFGLCNELGSGAPSYSNAARERFVDWLATKYETIENLNAAWTTQRWSRKLNSFQDVVLPISGHIQGAPERVLDMWRFYSDETLAYMHSLSILVKKLAPGARETTNHWSENPGYGFDYLKQYRDIVDLPGIGFYPGTNPEDRRALTAACFFMDHRTGELDEPIWCLEFQTGDFGGYGSPRKAMRMYAYLSLIHRSQAVCAWTWRSMLGGEEQYIFGLLDHDGIPGWKYDEFKQFSEEFKLLQDRGFPRKPQPEIAIAYSYESLKVMAGNRSFYKTDYTHQVLQAYEALVRANLDCNIVNLRDMRKDYKILIVPGHAVMDKASAAAIRSYVENGGTVIMTAYSAKVNEHNQVFDTTLPGELSDVFGIRCGAFMRTRSHTPVENAGGLEKAELRLERERPAILLGGNEHVPEIDYYEILETRTAKAMASFTNTLELSPAVTRKIYGKGEAIYVAIPADTSFLSSLLEQLYPKLGVNPGPTTPLGVVARKLEDDSTIYVNTTGTDQTIQINKPAKGLLTGRHYEQVMVLSGYEAELLI